MPRSRDSREAKTEVLDFRRFCGTLEQVRKRRCRNSRIEVVEARKIEAHDLHQSLRRKAERSRQRRKSGENLAPREIRHDGKGSVPRMLKSMSQSVKYSGAAEARMTEGFGLEQPEYSMHFFDDSLLPENQEKARDPGSALRARVAAVRFG